MDDVRQMRQNAQIYNGMGHYVTLIAGELEDLAEAKLDEKKDEILNLEHLLAEHGFK